MKWGMPVMTRSRLFFNSSIIRQNLRQHGWIGILYTLLLLFVLPLEMFMESNPLAEPNTVDNLFNIGGADIAPFLIAFPVVAGLFLFRYLQSKMPSDLWHSLPLRRSHLLASHTVSGLILLLVPVWLTAAVTAIVRPLDGNMYIYQGADVWEWCLVISVLTLFLYVFTIFVGICTGQTILQGIVVFILLILPAALLQFTDMHLNRYLYGYPEGSSLWGTLINWAPLLRIMNISYEPLSNKEIWSYILLSAVFMVLSFVLYRKRHSEKATQAMAFTYFNPLFKGGVMLCSMLLASSYFGSIRQQPGWIIGSAIAGGVIGYIVVEMILRKTWHILNRRMPLEFVVYGVLLGLLLYVPVSELTGYENRVPRNDKVTEVFAGGNYGELTRNPQGITTREEREDEIFSADRKYIEAVTALHHAVVASKPDQQHNTRRYDYRESKRFTFAYRLESGRKLMRTYIIPAAGFEPELKAVMEHAEYKRDRYLLSRMDENVESFRLSNLNKVISISDPQDVQEFNEILKREILNMSYEDEVSDQRARASINLVYKPDSTDYQLFYTYEWLPSFKEMTAWLEQKGYAGKIKLTAADVLSAEMFRDIHQSAIPQGLIYDPDTRLELARSEKRSAVVTDKTLIDSILEHRRDFTREEGRYVVKIEYKGGTVNYISLHEQDVAPALKALLP
ncbi:MULTISPECIES: YrzE family protein [unclassified Paenibacillus]|uniref:YrzE family protein n=1 Tax=unclassified Paenibacillus TaxID=185978 RepID=UPI0030F50E85